jgi:Protein of unknown function (DUF4256)
MPKSAPKTKQVLKPVYDSTKILSQEEIAELLLVLKTRFEKNMHRHINMDWSKIHQKLVSKPDKIKSLYWMEQTAGEPDVVSFNQNSDELIFCDCSKESPKGRVSLCYDRDAHESRKEFKPVDTAMDLAEKIGIEILTEEQYRELQKKENFDTKTSSWLLTPIEVRQHGGAIFGDWRFGRVFVYHNGAGSYYNSRGFRGRLLV